MDRLGDALSRIANEDRSELVTEHARRPYSAAKLGALECLVFSNYTLLNSGFRLATLAVPSGAGRMECDLKRTRAQMVT
jgi:hypothetical protein